MIINNKLIILICLTTLSLIAYIIYLLNRMPTSSIMYKNFLNHMDVINNTVKLICISHCGIISPLFNTFTDGHRSHYNIVCIDEFNNFILVSTGLTIIKKMSVAAYYIDPEKITKLKNNSIKFIDCDNWQYIIKLADIKKPKDKIKVIDVIEKYYITLTKLKKFEQFGKNCQYVSKKVFNYYVSEKNHLDLNTDSNELFTNVFNEMFDYNVLVYKNKII